MEIRCLMHREEVGTMDMKSLSPILQKKVRRASNASKIHDMTDYLFWPQELTNKEFNQREECLEAVAIALRGTDHVVLDIVSSKLLQTVKLDLPYSSIGVKSTGASTWEFHGRNFCVIEFAVPNLNLLQFFSLDPISLSLPEKEIESNDKIFENTNLEKLWEHPRYQAHDRKLRQSLSLVNLFHTHYTAFRNKYPRLCPQNEKLGDKLWIFVKSQFVSSTLHMIISYFCLYVTVVSCQLASWVCFALNYGYLPLVNISVMAQQIDLRCQQICYFPVQYLRINMNVSLRKALPRFRTYSEASANLRKDLPSKYYPDYIRFYNTVWLILNDVSFGLICGAFLYELHEELAANMHRIITFCLYDMMKIITISLANNPIGIKLNEELARFLSDLFLWIIEFSNAMLIKPMANEANLQIFLRTVANLGCVFGGTFATSVVVDYFSVLTVHIYIFYRISSKIYHWQLNIMISLFHLFCGKKKNVLRHRIDHNFFQLDELLLGTLFFIILVFLMPTVLAFYISFTALRMATITLEIAFESLIALLNHFPLFALLLRLKDPRRIPGGIYMRILNTENAVRFELVNKPLSIILMFKPYLALMNQLRGIYFSPKTLEQIILGKPFVTHRNKLYQMLYSSLPSKPVEIGTLYGRLVQLLTADQKKTD